MLYIIYINIYDNNINKHIISVLKNIIKLNISPKEKKYGYTKFIHLNN